MCHMTGKSYKNNSIQLKRINLCDAYQFIFSWWKASDNMGTSCMATWNDDDCHSLRAEKTQGEKVNLETSLLENETDAISCRLHADWMTRNLTT